MRKYIIGFIIGLVLGAAISSYAAARYVLVQGNGTEIGTTANPINITLQ